MRFLLLISLMMACPFSYAAKKDDCLKYLSFSSPKQIQKAKKASLRRRLDSMAVLFERKPVRRNDTEFLLSVSHAFEGAWEEWLNDFRTELLEAPDDEDIGYYGYLFDRLQGLQKMILDAQEKQKIPQENRISLGAFNSTLLKNLFDESSPLAKSTLLAFVISRKATEPGPYIEEWVRTYDSISDQERGPMVFNFQGVIIRDARIWSAIAWHLDEQSLAFHAFIARRLLGFQEFNDLRKKAVRKVLLSDSSELVRDVLIGLRVPYDRPLGLDFNYEMIASSKSLSKSAPDDYEDLLVRWLPRVDPNNHGFREFINEFLLLPAWSEKTEFAIAEHLSSEFANGKKGVGDILNMLLYHEPVRNLEASERIKDVLRSTHLRPERIWNPIIEDLSKKYGL